MKLRTKNSQRGEGRQLWGEGFTGTNIKDTWTKPRGRVEAGEEEGFGWGGVEKKRKKNYSHLA